MVNTFVPDTNIWSFWFKGKYPNLQRKMEREFERLRLSVVVYSELLYGAEKSGVSEHFKRVQNLAQIVPILPFEKDDVIHYAHLRAQLEKKGFVIGPYDMQIAAQALRTSASLITNNTREFKRIANLKVLDWTQT